MGPGGPGCAFWHADRAALTAKIAPGDDAGAGHLPAPAGAESSNNRPEFPL